MFFQFPIQLVALELMVISYLSTNLIQPSLGVLLLLLLLLRLARIKAKSRMQYASAGSSPFIRMIHVPLLLYINMMSQPMNKRNRAYIVSIQCCFHHLFPLTLSSEMLLTRCQILCASVNSPQCFTKKFEF